MRFFHILALKMLKNAQNAILLVLFDFRQLLFYYLPQKNASKYPKIAIFKIDIFHPSYVNVFYMIPRQYF